MKVCTQGNLNITLIRLNITQVSPNITKVSLQNTPLSQFDRTGNMIQLKIIIL